MNQTPTILTITGSDGTCCSGIQADIRLIGEMGATPVSVVTSVTAQNTLGIQEFYDLPATAVRLQMEAIVNDLQPQVVKIGLLRRTDVVEVIADVIRSYRPQHVVYAPVVESVRGERLVSDEVNESIQRLILPLCTMVLRPRPEGPHGQVNRLSAATAVLLGRGLQPTEALRQARQLTGSTPTGYAVTSCRADELYRQFIAAVERFFRRYADVAFYAEQLNVSPRYLGQVTRRIANRSPKSVIDERITTEIERLLTTTPHSLKEIASLMGFSSQAHLSRFFKKQRGVSPTKQKNRAMGTRSIN